MFASSKQLEVTLINFIYDSRCLRVAVSERSVNPISNCLYSPKGNGAYINFSIMYKEKENVAVEAYNALLYHVWEMIPNNPDEREQMRDNLKELYHSWLDDGGRDTTAELWPQYTSLYRYFDRFLELCKNIDRKEFIEFLKESINN